MPLKEDEKKESDEEILRDVEREMAKPRVAKSARRAAAVSTLGDHFKSGQQLSVQNRPTEVAVQD